MCIILEVIHASTWSRQVFNIQIRGCADPASLHQSWRNNNSLPKHQLAIHFFFPVLSQNRRSILPQLVSTKTPYRISGLLVGRYTALATERYTIDVLESLASMGKRGQSGMSGLAVDA